MTGDIARIPDWSMKKRQQAMKQTDKMGGGDKVRVENSQAGMAISNKNINREADTDAINTNVWQEATNAISLKNNVRLQQFAAWMIYIMTAIARCR